MSPPIESSHVSQAEAAWLAFIQHRFDNARASIHDLDQELALVRKYETMAKQRRNARTQACKLPVEILGEIFHYTRSIWKAERTHKTLGPSHAGGATVTCLYAAGWMSIIHVCSAWRSTALSLPTLWQDVDILDIHPDYSYDILARSARRPLRISNTGYERFDGDDLLVALALCTWFSAPVFRRLEILKFRGTGLPAVVFEALARPAPMLQNLDIATARPQFLPRNMLDLDLMMYSDVPCQLSTLKIARCYLPSDTHLLASTLVHLRLDYDERSYEDHHLAIAKVLLALSSMFALETLFLGDVPRQINANESNVDTPLPHVDLPIVFRELRLELNRKEYLAPLVDLIKHISMPHTATVAAWVFAELYHEDENNITMSRRLLESTTVFHTGGPMSLELEATTVRYNIHSRGRLDESRPSHRLLYLNASDSIMYDLLPALQFAQVTSLVVRDLDLLEQICSQALGIDTWTESFSKAQSVESLTLLFSHSAGLWAAFSRPGSTLFPKLSSITLLDLIDRDWAALNEECEAAVRRHIPPLVLGLVEVIESRKEASMPVLDVKMSNSMASWDVWGAVRRLVRITTI